MRDWCRRRCRRWDGSAAGGWVLTGLPLLGAAAIPDVVNSLLCFRGIVLDDLTFEKSLVVSEVGMPDEADWTCGGGHGEIKLEFLLRRWKSLVDGGSGGSSSRARGGRARDSGKCGTG